MNIRALAAAVGTVATISAGSIYAAAPANAGPPPLCVSGDLSQGWCEMETAISLDPLRALESVRTCPSRAQYLTRVAYKNTTADGYNHGSPITDIRPNANHTQVVVRLYNADKRFKLFGRLSWSCRNVPTDEISLTVYRDEWLQPYRLSAFNLECPAGHIAVPAPSWRPQNIGVIGTVFVNSTGGMTGQFENRTDELQWIQMALYCSPIEMPVP